MVDTLVSQPSEFSDYMSRNVRPHIEGTDMARLQLYYKLIDGCPIADSDKVSPETHRKLLGRLIPAAPGDYDSWASFLFFAISGGGGRRGGLLLQWFKRVILLYGKVDIKSMSNIFDQFSRIFCI